MADLFNNNNSENRDELVESIISALLDVANSSRQFSNELKENTKNASKFKRDTQSAMMSMLSETRQLNKDARELDERLKEMAKSFPDTVEKMLASTEKGLAFQTRGFDIGFRLEKMLNPVFNEFKLAQRKELDGLNDEIKELGELVDAAKGTEDEATYERLKNIKEEQYKKLKDLDAYDIMRRQNSKFFFDQAGKITKKVLGDLFNFVKQKVTSAINNYNQTMEQTYTLIQSYNNYTVKQYDALFNRLKKSIDNSGLSSIIDINELQQSYANTVQGGLFGSAAEKNAYYKQIAEQAGITFDWTDTNWMKTVSRLQKSGADLDLFMQSIITATENMTEAAGNGFAFTGNQINTMVENLNRLQSSLDLTDDAYISAYKSFGTVGSMLNEWGIDASKIYADITEYAEKGITTANKSTASVLNMGGMTQDKIRSEISAGRTNEVVLNYLSELQSRYDRTSGEFIDVASSALSESLSNEEILAYQNYIKNLSDQGKTVKDEYDRIYNYDKWAYDNMVESLSNTETEMNKITNWMDNYFAELGKFMNQHPILSTVGSSLLSGVGSMAGAWISSGLMRKSLQTMLQKAGLGGEVLKTGGGSVTGGTSLLSKLGGAFSNGATGLGAGAEGSIASKITSSGLGKVAFSTGGKILGAAGSAIWIGADAYKGYKEGGAEGALRGAITGSGKAAESTGDVLKGTGIAALKGAGIGMTFGPWGAAIGAAIGGIAGLAVTIRDLNDEELQRAKRFEKFDSYIDKSNKATEIFSKNIEKINKLDDLQKSSQEGNIDATNELIKKYPILSRYVDENGRTTDEYNKVLEQLLENEKNRLNKEVVAAYGTSTGITSADVNTGLTNTADKLSKTGTVLNIRSKIGDSNINNNSPKYKASTITNVMGNSVGPFEMITTSDGEKAVGLRTEITDYLKNTYGISDDDLNQLSDDELFGMAIAYGVIDADEVSDKRRKGYTDAWDKASKLEFSESDYSELKKYYDASVSSVNLLATVGQYDSLISAANKMGMTQDDIINRLNAAFFSYNSVMKYARNEDRAIRQLMQYVAGDNYNIDDPASWVKSTYGEYTPGTIFKKFGGEDAGLYPVYYALNDFNIDKYGARHAYATGTTGDSTIPYDMLAYVHEGEQIRTKADVAIEQAEQHVASSDAIGKLNSAVLKQTDTIINLLTQILSVTTSLSSRINQPKGQTYNYSAVPIN